MKKVLNKYTVIGLLLAAVAVGAMAFSRNHVSGAPRIVFESPDGRYRIGVYTSKQCIPIFPMMPGQSGDAPGTVCLFETATGKILRRTSVEMVQIVDRVEWSATNAYIKFVADWTLP